MTLLTLPSGHELQLDVVALASIKNPSFFNGVRTLEVNLYLDDHSRDSRSIITVKLFTTLAGNLVRHREPECTWRRLSGYDKEKNCWTVDHGVQNLELPTRHAKRAYNTIKDWIETHLVMYQNGPTYYRHRGWVNPSTL